MPSGINKSVSLRLVYYLLYSIFKCFITNRLILSVAHDSTDRKGRQHVAVQSLIYEVDLAYQPDGRPAVDAGASRVCDIQDKGPRPCGGWKNPAGTHLCSFLLIVTLPNSSMMMMMMMMVMIYLEN